MKTFLSQLVPAALNAVLTAVALYAVLAMHDHAPTPGPAPAPVPAFDARFVPIGQGYRAPLAACYAGAFEDGAKLLESGQSLAMALGAIGTKWSADRATLFDRTLAPEFAKIIPPATKDADITPDQRAAMARAWRGVAAGLRKP